MGGGRLMAATHCNTRAWFRYELPRVSPWLLRWFLRYAQGYARRSFHTVRVAEERHALAVAGRPLLVYMNHPSWWDPILAAVLAQRYFPASLHYSPIDAAALQKYKFFSKLGFFGVARGDVSSGRRLLDVGAQALSRRNSVLWITPQGRFSDVRQRPLNLSSGLAHLIRRSPDCVVLPVALEYCFWEEKTPEALVRFGSPLTGFDLQEMVRTPNRLAFHLEETMDALAQDSIQRNGAAFQTILAGRAGVGGVYDAWRRLKARFQGEAFRAEHGDRA
jgi:1-acyl-sn-glycerol-3-phosphate acyltransferase